MLWKTIGIVLFVCFAKTLAINDTQDLVGVRVVNKAAVTDETRTHREETSTESSDCTGKGLFSGCYYMKLAKYLTGYLGGSYGGLEPNFTPPIAGFGSLPSQGTPSGGIPGTPSSTVETERENSTTEAWDGSYSWKFYVPEGEISAEENGTVDQNVPEGPGTVVRGSFSFSAPDGSHFRVIYTADERGFLPSGDHLPTSPPIPEAILKALFKNAADEEAGIFDDGSYKEGRG